MNSIDLAQLEAERARVAKAREDLKNNLIAHDGALQAYDQLILLAKNGGKRADKEALPAPLAENGGASARDATADD